MDQMSAMRNPAILSASSTPTSVSSPEKPERARAPVRAEPSIFDACQIGVVLRTVVFVEAVVAIATLFVVSTLGDWLVQAATVTGGALPATLLWLVAACGLKKPLRRLPKHWQYTAGAVLGALAALYGCGLLRLTGVLASAPWVASALTGALFAGLVMAAMVLRARGQTPAATTARLAELQSRIRPHFLFNTLNTAITLASAGPARTENLLEDLAELFRVALADSGESVSAVGRVALAKRYLAIEQVRFGDRLQHELGPRRRRRRRTRAAAAAAAAGGERGAPWRGAVGRGWRDPHPHAGKAGACG
jgi:two-component system sensor histidine kinase AlgZ